jgi:hypothetical protein
LLAKLHFCGIKGLSEYWFRSNVTNRLQKVFEVISPNATQNFTSNWGTMKHGDPLLFITYVIEPPPIINCVSEPLLFSDDTNINFKQKF